MIICERCKQEIKLTDSKKYDESAKRIYHRICFARSDSRMYPKEKENTETS